MIVLIHKGLESDSKRGTTRTEITPAGKAAGPAVKGSVPGGFLAPGEECFPVVALKWNFPDSSPVLAGLAVAFFAFHSTWVL